MKEEKISEFKFAAPARSLEFDWLLTLLRARTRELYYFKTNKIITFQKRGQRGQERGCIIKGFWYLHWL